MSFVLLLLLLVTIMGVPCLGLEAGEGLENPIIVALPPSPARAPYMHSAWALALPPRAPSRFTVPYAGTTVTVYDFSLPTQYRMIPPLAPPPLLPWLPVSADVPTLPPALESEWKREMWAYHTRHLAERRVARPMEINFPRLIKLQESDASEQMFAASKAVHENAWLLSGEQIRMLNRAQFKLRSLSIFPLNENNWGDKVENAALRSHLDRVLKVSTGVEEGVGEGRVDTFPDALKVALGRVKEEQREFARYRAMWEGMEMDWDRQFPFLVDGRIEPGWHLLHL